MYLIGLTGGIASGKSTVTKIFAEDYGIPIIDADLISRQIVEPHKKGWYSIKRLFGDSVFEADGTVNRDKLGDIIFNDEKSRRLLNKSMHKLIAIEMLKQVVWNFLKGYRYVIIDAPLLFEAKMFLKLFTFKIVVYCNEEQQLHRLLNRNKQLSEADAKARIQSQMNTSEKIKLADVCIDNSRDLDYTKQQVHKLYTKFESSKAYVKIRLAVLSVVVALAYFGVCFCK